MTISSPAATGGAGTLFEQHVAAYWLAQLLVRSIPPILTDTLVAEVHLQTEWLGWHTDDFLISCKGQGETPRQIAGQVKTSFTVGAANEDCKKAIGDFWRDFQNRDRFALEADRLVLVTQRGTNALLGHFVNLLDEARAARDGAEFERRLATKGLISSKAVEYCGELQKIITDVEGRPTTQADIWPLLRALHVVSLDLDTSTRQTEAHIKSLLAHTAVHGDPITAAEVSWNELLNLAGTAMSTARSLRHADLPEPLRSRHASVGGNEQRVLHALKDHTALILRGIGNTIGERCHLPRTGLVHEVLEELEKVQVVLLSGPAGSGKSAIGKDVLSLLSQDHFVFGFRVEEFAQPHLDATLSAAQIPANGTTVSAILASQSRKVILVESVERLLEKATRDAFDDLMTLTAADGSIRVLLTCRDYSVDLVCASFLQPTGIAHSVVKVPHLDDAELAEIEAAIPALMFPLRNTALRDILRNPYFLDRALQIRWAAERPVPESEREFRALFWREIVRADHRNPSGMARRREEMFQQVAVRRARALSAYVVCSDLDPAVIAALRNDSLISSADENPLLIATAHDVLEDWAILQWLEEQRLTFAGSFERLSGAIGTHPAIRRSYRKWVAELVDRSADDVDRLFRAALTETEISAHFRDDTLIALLKAPSSSQFLLRHEVDLLANDKALLKRVIYLLRVACVTTPVWLGGAAGEGSAFNVPDGPAWTTVLRLVHQNIDQFTKEERPLVLGLIEDAVRGVSWWEPELESADSIVAVAHRLLASYDNYYSEGSHRRVLQVIAKLPKADPMRFAAVMRGTEKQDKRRDHIAEDFREMVLSGLHGMPAARDLPDLVVSIAADHLLASEEDLRGHENVSGLDLEQHFGIKAGLEHEFFPVSAIRGPWIPLLTHHPYKALDFYVKVFNHSADWYAHPRVQDPLEAAWEIELTFADGTKRKQWGNSRLWNLYRGTSVGPHVLQTLLMALEKWLLDLAIKYPQYLDGYLIEILRRSDSAALSAVVASVAIAHPHAAGESLLVLLSAPDYVSFDRERMALEHGASALAQMWPQLQEENKIFEAERKRANGLPHRGKDLESAIANLQLGPLRPRVYAILDRHLANLPPKAEQDESHLTWRLAIHRMDLRQYKVADEQKVEVSDTEQNGAAYVRLEPKPPDPDVQAMVDAHATEFNVRNQRLAVWMWARHLFERKTGDYGASQWKEKLTFAQTMDLGAEESDGTRHGPGTVAAVCVRDRWNEMSVDERNWCVDTIVSEIKRHSDAWSPLERLQRFSMGADRACARVIPLLLGKSLSKPRLLQVQQAFAVALTHPVDEVRWSVTWGVDSQFFLAHREISMQCVNAIATEAMHADGAWNTEKLRPYDVRRHYEVIRAEAAAAIRQLFWQERGIDPDAHTKFDISAGFGAEASLRVLAILGQIPDDPKAVATFARASGTLAKWWDHRYDAERRSRRNYDAETVMCQRLQEFAMQTQAASALAVLGPILEAIERHPRQIYSFVQGLTNIEDSLPNTQHYWYLWELFANSIRQAKWSSRLSDADSFGSEMLSAIFLTLWWKDDVRHWVSLEGYDHQVHSLFEALPPSSIVLDNYVRFLYHIGERSLPHAFVRIANSLRRRSASAMLQQRNTVFILEVLLQRSVYRRPLELKTDRAIREAVLFILDTLVENGSSAAFRMRDDFVTPAS